MWANALLADAKLTDDVQIPLRIDASQIIQKATTTTDHTQQTPAAGVVLLVQLHVLSQVVDSAGEQRDLNFRRTGVAVRLTELLD